MRTRLATAAALSVLLAVGACSESDRPSVEELSAALTSNDAAVPVPEQAADCVAQGLLDSDLSDETLREIADEKTPTGQRDDVTALGSSLVDDCLADD